jgi:hypothetical protein
MVFPLAALGVVTKRVLIWCGIGVGVGAVAVATPELLASDQRGARESAVDDVTFPVRTAAVIAVDRSD